MTELRQLSGVRLSQLARCPRACALQGLGVEPEPPTERMRRYWTRGQMFAWYGWRQLCEQYGEDAIEREREVPWPLGVGHIDLYVRPERLIVEVKSSTSPASVIDAAMRQARLQLRFDPEAEHAAIYVIDPSDLDREDFLPVKLRDQDVEEIDRLVEEVGRAIEGGDLPACTASDPTSCRYSGCGFTEAAWAGWMAPPAPSLDDPELVAAALDWYRQREYRRELETGVASAKLVETELRDRLLELGLPEGESVLGGKLRVKRTKITGRVTARIAEARKAGVWTDALDELLGDYVRVSEPSERLTATLLSGAELPPAEFGDEVPF